MKDIFISYRHSDSPGVTGRIFDRLKTRFGESRLFIDFDSIRAGLEFPNKISEAIAQCKVLIAIIGEDWLTTVDDVGHRRIDSSDDYVQLEIGAALGRDIPVIPVLLHSAPMPQVEDLPLAIKGLVRRQGIKVRQDPDFNADVDRLCKEISLHLKDDGIRRRIIVSALFVLIAIIGAYLRDFYLPGGSSTKTATGFKSPPRTSKKVASL